MNCPNCKSNQTFIVDSRACGNSTRRRRECEGCGERWSTLEISVEEHLKLVASNKQMQSTLARIQDALFFDEGE